MKSIKITNELKDRLLNLSMNFVSTEAYNKLEEVIEGDYFYIAIIDNNNNVLISKDSADYMISNIWKKDSTKYKEWGLVELYEIVDGYYSFKQYSTDSEFALYKQSYWRSKRREDIINKILVD